MICTGCMFSLSRTFLHEEPRHICLLDGKEMSLRLAKCDGFQKELVGIKEEIISKVEGVKRETHNVTVNDFIELPDIPGINDKTGPGPDNLQKKPRGNPNWSKK